MEDLVKFVVEGGKTIKSLFEQGDFEEHGVGSDV